MEIQVLYFAVFRERIGRERETIELPEGTDVAGAVAILAARHEPVRALAGRFQVAVNQTVVSAKTPLKTGDELALIPPVAGGSDAAREAGRHARIVEGPPSLDRCIAAVASPAMGGVVAFTGMVREQSRGRRVERLEYEAYVEMAEKLLCELCAEVEVDHQPCRAAVEHRIGELDVGDLVVTIAVAAPHRDEAFAGCRALIDRLKERAPIWKKETTSDGAEWVGLGP
jgi:molybdopterin converting factor subunit 1